MSSELSCAKKEPKKAPYSDTSDILPLRGLTAWAPSSNCASAVDTATSLHGGDEYLQRILLLVSGAEVYTIDSAPSRLPWTVDIARLAYAGMQSPYPLRSLPLVSVG